jgi:hypothetical protein
MLGRSAACFPSPGPECLAEELSFIILMRPFEVAYHASLTFLDRLRYLELRRPFHTVLFPF